MGENFNFKNSLASVPRFYEICEKSHLFIEFYILNKKTENSYEYVASHVTVPGPFWTDGQFQ